ncbi:MDR family MFS transporter [Streptomyces sp. NRRL S-1868]|uniref:MDR family MFS transporter n=1 Tax=Streptomyces sp. NRRL S-1868 TaxID=1463892 RepID=UPI00068CA033|nr:MDR family MFS transporter [Streptomyces sp. NRRL S-1868]
MATTTTTSTAERTELMRVLPGLLLAMLLAQLDAMIVSTALPTIVAELGGVNQLSWVVTAYTLATLASTPLYGKLGDLYSRKWTLVFAISVFLLGSVLSGLAQSIGQLIAFRALQGIGAGGLLVGVISIIGRLATPRERGRFQSFIAALGAVAMIGGPLLGGFLTDVASWRWAFLINVPIGAVALFIVLTRLSHAGNKVEHRIDYLGALVIASLAVVIVLVTSWGGVDYAWGSPQIIGLAIAGVVLLAVMIAVERKAAEPVLPLGLFKVRNFTVAQILTFLVGFAMYSLIAFLPLYQQAAHGYSATSSGLLLLPMLGASLVTTMYSGKLLTKTDNHRTILVGGGALFGGGLLLMLLVDQNTSPFLFTAYMIVFGLGLGVLFQVTVVTAQNSVDRATMGVASSTVTFSRSIGGSFGVALFGAVFTGRLLDGLAKRLPADEYAELRGSAGKLDPDNMRALSAPVHRDYVVSVADATHNLFLWAAPFGVLAFLIAFFVRAGKPAE